MWVSTPPEGNVPQGESASNGFCLPPSGRWDNCFFSLLLMPLYLKNKTKQNETKQNKNLTPVGFAMPGI